MSASRIVLILAASSACLLCKRTQVEAAAVFQFDQSTTFSPANSDPIVSEPLESTNPQSRDFFGARNYGRGTRLNLVPGPSGPKVGKVPQKVLGSLPNRVLDPKSGSWDYKQQVSTVSLSRLVALPANCRFISSHQ